MKSDKPFSHNPFTTLPAVMLVPVPPTPETHTPRTPLRSYLAPHGGGSLSDLLSSLGAGKKQRPIVVEKHVEVPKEDDENWTLSPSK